jgi:environmental stress-induced protein Ves
MPAHWHRFSLAALPAERWANGGGVTRTLLTGPPDAAGRRLWRISVADIPGDADFSQWTGWRRESLLIEGGPLDLLADDGERLAFRTLGAAVAYDGGRRWSARLQGPAARFLNAMSQGDAPPLTIRLLQERPVLQATDRLLLVLRGTVQLDDPAAPGQRSVLGPGEGLCHPVDEGAAPDLVVSPDFVAALVGSAAGHPCLPTSTRFPTLP